MNESPETKKPSVHHIPITCESPTEKRQINTTLHTPVPAPSVDDMEPQNISFIGEFFHRDIFDRLKCEKNMKNNFKKH